MFIFIDGLGIGPPDPEVNPLAASGRKLLAFAQGSLDSLPGGGRCIPTDACLGVPGLPQSATGQTTLFTGQNAAAAVGRHIQGFPTRELRELIARESLFRQLQERNRRVTFANAYTPRFFHQRPRWVSVTTTMCETAGVPLRQLASLRAGRSLFMDFSNGLLREMGLDVPVFRPEEAASILTALAEEHDLCLYEFFLTDLVGHRGTFQQAVELLNQLEAFLLTIVQSLDLSRMSLLITSDHGNLEDMSHSSHTRNPVPTLIWGPLQAAFPPAQPAFDLTRIAPALIRHLNGAT